MVRRKGSKRPRPQESVSQQPSPTPSPPTTTSTKPSWASLPWRKVDLSSSTHTLRPRHQNGDSSESFGNDDSEYIDADNHYDDPDADGSDLFDVGVGGGKKKKEGKGKRRREDEDGMVEGANDPGIIVGLEVIDGSMYMLEKIRVGGNENGGSVNRLVASGGNGAKDDKRKDPKIGKEGDATPATNPGEKTKKKKSKRKPKPPPPNKKTKPTPKPLPTTLTTPTASPTQITTIQTSWSHATAGAVLHPTLCASLHRLSFTSPTPIQAATLAASILGRRDIVGAAPTGSGKTLSYLLPVLQYLLYERDEEREGEGGGEEVEKEVKVRHVHPLTALVLCPTRELALQVSKEFVGLLPPPSTNGGGDYDSIRCGCIVGGLSEHKQKRVLDRNRPPVIVGTPGRLWELMAGKEHNHLNDLTKLRFLVVDEADRMISQGNFPQLNKIFEQIQKDDLIGDLEEGTGFGSRRKGEEYDMENDEGNKLMGLQGVAKVTMLDDVLRARDESAGGGRDDVGVVGDSENDASSTGTNESGSSSGSEEDAPVHRQTFVYSATLTLPPSSDRILSSVPKPNAKDKKRKRHDANTDVTVEGAIAEILERAGAIGETKIVNLATDTSTSHNPANTHRPSVCLPPGLSLHEIHCTQRHKDSHLYAYLTTTPQGSSGPCLVFCNSIGAVKRVGETLRVLGLPARTLHAGMQQKARFAALESLRPSSQTGETQRSVVVATDVAARGLDIPSVSTVIHYDVPRSTDTFVHRSGRTARGIGPLAVGTSVSLVSAAEEKEQARICHAVLGGEDSGKARFEGVGIDGKMMTAAQARVNLASKVVACEDATSRTERNNKWFIDAAKDADLDLDEGMLDEGMAGGSRVERLQLLEAKRAKVELKVLLGKPMRRQGFGKFLSGVGMDKSRKMEEKVKPFVVKSNGGKMSGRGKKKKQKM